MFLNFGHLLNERAGDYQPVYGLKRKMRLPGTTPKLDIRAVPL
jgi:hypothetical protein